MKKQRPVSDKGPDPFVSEVLVVCNPCGRLVKSEWVVREEAPQQAILCIEKCWCVPPDDARVHPVDDARVGEIRERRTKADVLKTRRGYSHPLERPTWADVDYLLSLLPQLSSSEPRRCPHCGRRMKSNFDPDAGKWYECENCDYRESVSSAPTTAPVVEAPQFESNMANPKPESDPPVCVNCGREIEESHYGPPINDSCWSHLHNNVVWCNWPARPSTATPDNAPAATAAREIVTAWLWHTSEGDQQRARIDIERRLRSIFAPLGATGEGVE